MRFVFALFLLPSILLTPAPARGQVPEIRVSRVTVGPRYRREFVQRVIRRHHGELRRCYEEQLKSEPSP